jgi:hypothetical protein
MIKQTVSFFLFSLMTCSALLAQNIEIGLAGGGCYYLGDLNPSKHFSGTQLSYGVLARYNINDRWAAKLGVTRAKVKGDAASSSFLPERQLSFTSDLTDISAVAEFNFLPYFTGSKRNWISPYIYAGINLFFFDPKADGISLKGLGTEGQNIGYEGRKPYSTIGFGIPFGLGVKFSLSRRLGMQAYWEMHKTFTDYLDDVSTTYYLNGPSIDPAITAEILSDPTRNHQAGMERGNSKNQDWYAIFGLSLTYKFDIAGNKRCRDLKH